MGGMSRRASCPWVPDQRRVESKQRVDKGRGRRASQKNQQTHQQQDQDDGGEPPLLVVEQEVGKLTQNARLGFLGLFGWAVQGFLTKYPSVKVVDVLSAHGGHGH